MTGASRRTELSSDDFELESPNGLLAAHVDYDPEAESGDGVLLLTPHPRLGGDMENNVLRALAPRLATAGYVALRFDYHDTGKSGNTKDIERRIAYWSGDRSGLPEIRALDDATAARAWLGAWASPVHVVGYSFGGALALSLAHSSTEGVRVVAIAPPILGVAGVRVPEKPSAVPMLVIAAENDFATPVHALEHWSSGAGPLVEFTVVRGADHFFRGREDEVVERVEGFLRESRHP